MNILKRFFMVRARAKNNEKNVRFHLRKTYNIEMI